MRNLDDFNRLDDDAMKENAILALLMKEDHSAVERGILRTVSESELYRRAVARAAEKGRGKKYFLFLFCH